MTQSEKLARLQLALTAGIGSSKFMQVIAKFGSAEEFWQQWKINKQCINLTIKLPSNALIEKARTQQFLVLGEQSYPPLLAQINDPPPVLFYQGNLSQLDQQLISVVGTRNFSSYGHRVTKEIVTSLQKEHVVVSGMALGIDTLAHKTALDSGLNTIAVLPSPLAKPYPWQNKQLFEKIIEEGGLVVSEYLSEQAMHKANFVRRNRIIAGLSDTCIVVEAPKKSGALITAHLAFNYNRRVLAVVAPWEQATGMGCNQLIRDNVAELFGKISDLGVLCESYSATIKAGGLASKVIAELKLASLSGFELESRISAEHETLYKVLVQMEIEKIIVKDLLGNYSLVV